ncbi:hypothetical protein FKM82_002262 [Ascaphus truei]
MICVVPGIYLGNANDAAEPQRLQESGITHVLTVDSEEPKDLASFGTKFVHLLDESSADLLSCLPECLRFVNEALGTAGSSVLVHCHAGVSRSAAVVTAYLMHTSKLAFQDAYTKLQSLKPDVNSSVLSVATNWARSTGTGSSVHAAVGSPQHFRSIRTEWTK